MRGLVGEGGERGYRPTSPLAGFFRSHSPPVYGTAGHAKTADMGTVLSPCCCDDGTTKYTVKTGGWTSPFQAMVQAARLHAGKPVPTIVVCGGTGTGKSNLGNFLLGRSAFVVQNSQESVTTSAAVFAGTWFGGQQSLRVVDCPGIHDTKGATADQTQFDTTIALLKVLEQVNALILVMKAGRFTKFDRDVICTLRDSFGAGFWRNMCVFQTGATAKPGQLDLDVEAPKIRMNLQEIEREKGGNEAALKTICKLPVYAADLDPFLYDSEDRNREFRLKRALHGLELEDLLSLDAKVPRNLLDMPKQDMEKLLAGEPAIEKWIEGNYFQLGIGRLLTLKRDIGAMRPFPVGDISRLDRDNTPPPEDELSPDAETYEPGYFQEWDSIFDALVGSDTVLIKGSWIEKVFATGWLLPRRQELPAEAIWGEQELQQGVQDPNVPAPCVLAISYSWLSTGHPDPHGFHLSTFAPLLAPFASWRKISTSHIAVFIDWCSVPQLPRSPGETAAYRRALRHVHVWYSHSLTQVWQLSRVPDGFTSYEQRGWPHFERALCSLLTSSESVLDLGLLKLGWNGWPEVVQQCRPKRRPPFSPYLLPAELSRKTFSEESDREMLGRKYHHVFSQFIVSMEKLVLENLGWRDYEIQKLAEVLPMCSCLKALALGMNEVGPHGTAALADVLQQCGRLEILGLAENRIDTVAKEQLLLAWRRAGKPEEGLDMKRQRTSPTIRTGEEDSNTRLENSVGSLGCHGVFLNSLPSDPATSTPPSPAGAQAERLAAERRFQAPAYPEWPQSEKFASVILPERPQLVANGVTPPADGRVAELSARQAAFEARLLVSMQRAQRLTATLSSEMGTSAPLGAELASRTAYSPSGSRMRL